MNTIVLSKDVRLFQRSNGDNSPSLLLSRTGLYFKAGQEIAIGEPRAMCYDHRDQLVVPVINDDQYEVDSELFIIVEEMGNLNARQKV
ncbi:MAG TPA: hypothetical protein VFQ72_04205 [Candidatus Paceibacterota bacterium]|nr:hypothetical protein [Candidatus Paceibacterota bacterium]